MPLKMMQWLPLAEAVHTQITMEEIEAKLKNTSEPKSSIITESEKVNEGSEKLSEKRK